VSLAGTSAIFADVFSGGSTFCVLETARSPQRRLNTGFQTSEEPLRIKTLTTPGARHRLTGLGVIRLAAKSALARPS